MLLEILKLKLDSLKYTCLDINYTHNNYNALLGIAHALIIGCVLEPVEIKEGHQRASYVNITNCP